MLHWLTYFRFGFVRNPWDAQWSMYKYIIGMGDSHIEGAEVRNFINFEDYLDRYVKSKQLDAGFKGQSDFLLDVNNSPIVSFIGRYERLIQDFSVVTGELGLHATRLPHLNKSKDKGYRNYYTPAARKLVACLFERDIDNFKYAF